MHTVYSVLPAAVQQYDGVNKRESPNKLFYLQLTPIMQTCIEFPYMHSIMVLLSKKKREKSFHSKEKTLSQRIFKSEVMLGSIQLHECYRFLLACQDMTSCLGKVHYIRVTEPVVL